MSNRDFTVKVFLCGDYDFYSKMHGLPGASGKLRIWKKRSCMVLLLLSLFALYDTQRMT